MPIDPRRLKPTELVRLLNSTPLGEVISERQLRAVLRRLRNHTQGWIFRLLTGACEKSANSSPVLVSRFGVERCGS